jgi:hypothetical protein
MGRHTDDTCTRVIVMKRSRVSFSYLGEFMVTKTYCLDCREDLSLRRISMLTLLFLVWVNNGTHPCSMHPNKLYFATMITGASLKALL